ncbi:MAG: hypothetical protein U1E51_06820 [Candidatus Binatia bacterium]|nr:hypothetical protein [Candidatus Binatia bacterium]
MSKEVGRLIDLVAAMIDPKVRTATAVMSPTYTMRLSRVYRDRANARSRTFSLTLGGPNYEAREFIRRCQKAGEPFPVKKVQLRFWPKQRKA